MITLIIKATITALGIVLLTACTSPATELTAKPNTASITCGDERPQMCTKEYRPVCGTKDTGVRCITTPCPSVEYKTYGNACTACADERVISYVTEICEKQT